MGYSDPTIRGWEERKMEALAAARSASDEAAAASDASVISSANERAAKAMADFDALEEKIAARARILDAELRSEQVADNRVPLASERSAASNDDTEARHAEAIDAYMRTGDTSGIMREIRAQSVAVNSEGGYTVPVMMYNKIIETMQAYGPMLSPGVTEMLVTSSGENITIPTNDDTSGAAQIKAEGVAADDTSVTFGQKTLGVYTFTSGVVKVSRELMQDSAFDMQGFISRALGKRIGRTVNQKLTVGTGSGEPEGIVTAAGTGVTAASNAAIAADELIDLIHSVDPAYRGSPSFRLMFNDTTLKALRKLKFSGSGEYIWQPTDLRAGAPATILGVPYVVNQAMANIGANAKSIIVGDFSQYMVRTARGFAVERLNELYATQRQVGFTGFGRYGGILADDSAIKAMVHPT